MSKDDQILEEFTSREYEHGWTIDIEADQAPKGLNEEIIRFISAKKEEPQWLLDWRLESFRLWKEMDEPYWANLTIPEINYQDIIYYSAPKQRHPRRTWTRWIRNCLRHSKNSGYHLKNKNASLG